MLLHQCVGGAAQRHTTERESDFGEHWLFPLPEPRSTIVWDVTTGRPGVTLVGESNLVQFTNDGKWLCTSDMVAHRLWSVGSWRPGPEILIDRPIPGGFVQDAAGTVLAFRPTTRTIRLVDAHSRREIATFEPPNDPFLTHWDLSPDGGSLSATDAGKDAIVWDLSAVRARLAEYGLDWETPPIPPVRPSTPVTITIDRGG